MDTSATILAENLVPTNGGHRRLPGIDLEVFEHGATCLLAADTGLLESYLRALGGVDKAAEGQLFLLGEPVDSLSREAWLQLRPQLGFITHSAPLLSVLNGRENVLLPLLYHKLADRDGAESAADELLRELDCRADLSLLPAYYTLLERMQLAIARTALLSPKVLFLEEPFHGLYTAEHAPIKRWLMAWKETRALVVSTHNLGFVRDVADKIVFAADDKIHYFDSWREFNHCTDDAVVGYFKRYRESYLL